MKSTASALLTVVSAWILQSVVDLGGGIWVQAADHYCTRISAGVDKITGETDGSIYSQYQGDTHYRNNQNCEWWIDAGSGNRLEVSVISSDLQWAPLTAICHGYDHVAIKDVLVKTSTDTGDNGGEESIVLQWCGRSQPLGAVSSGRYVRVEFMSDKNNPYQYKGVHLRFRTFPSSECAPSWNSSSEGFCYKLLNKNTDWSSAQKECNTGQANLASVLSQREHDFLLQAFGSIPSSSSAAWIGLTDIVYEGEYRWIDKSPYSFNRFSMGHTSDRYSRCAAVGLSSGVWDLKDCENDKAKPLCKANKGSKTTIFPIPQRRPDETNPETPVGRVVAIAVSVVVLVIIVVVAFVLYRRYKNKPSDTNTTATTTTYHHSSKFTPAASRDPAAQSSNVGRHQQPSAPQPDERFEEFVMSNPDSRMLAPPAYEEALSHPVVSPSHV